MGRTPQKLTLKQQRTKNNNTRKTQKTKKLSYKEKNEILEQEIAKLYEGQSFENWIHLFDEIDTYYPDNSSSQQIAQQDIKRYIEIEKTPNSHELTIKQIYADPIEKADGRKGGNRSLYLPLLKTLVLYSLAQEEDIVKEFTYTQFWLEMGMRNQFYTNDEIRKRLPQYDNEITKADLDDFFRRTGIKNKNITDYLLDSLQDEGLLRYEKNIMIKEDNSPARRATYDEIAQIGTEEKKIMEKWGYKSKQALFLADRSKALYKEVKKILGYSYFEIFSVIVYKKEALEIGLRDNIAEVKKTLNKTIIDQNKLNAQKRHDKEYVKLEQEYKEYNNQMVLGEYKNEPEKYIEDHGNKLYKQDDYADKFNKMDQYFTATGKNKYIELLNKIERDIKIEDMEQRKEPLKRSLKST